MRATGRLVGLLLVAVTVASCGKAEEPDVRDSARCKEARGALDDLEPETERTKAAWDRTQAAYAADSTLGGGDALRAKEAYHRVIRQGAQTVLAEPACFDVKTVAGAREWLEQTR